MVFIIRLRALIIVSLLLLGCEELVEYDVALRISNSTEVPLNVRVKSTVRNANLGWPSRRRIIHAVG